MVLTHLQAGAIRGLLDLLERLDPACLLEGLDTTPAQHWIIAVGRIRHVVATWDAGNLDGISLKVDQMCGGSHPLTIIYQLLGHCADEAAPPDVDRMLFIADEPLRSSLARDIASVNALLRMEEWKAVTVIGGSVVEALLLSQLPSPQQVAAQKWELPQLITECKSAALITDDHVKACELVRAFRNLIHPGRERRLDQPCDRGTALSALAAVEHLIEHFRRRTVHG